MIHPSIQIMAFHNYVPTLHSVFITMFNQNIDKSSNNTKYLYLIHVNKKIYCLISLMVHLIAWFILIEGYVVICDIKLSESLDVVVLARSFIGRQIFVQSKKFRS